MKIALVVASMMALSTVPGWAMSMSAPASTASLYTCNGRGLSRVVATEQPAPCCAGLTNCPQLLANTGLVKPRRDNRT